MRALHARPLYASLVRLDRPPGARFTALYAEPARTRHVMTLARECAEGEAVDGAYRATFAPASRPPAS